MPDFSAQTAATDAVEFKGRMLTLSVLKLNSADLNQTEPALAAKVQRAADFFRNMPVLLDVAVDGIDLPPLVEMLRRYGLVPVAVVQPSAAVATQAAQAGLGVINDPKAARKAEATVAESSAESASAQPITAAAPPAKAARNATKVVSDPVRSGQQVYARGGDLVVLGAVSPGAEVLAARPVMEPHNWRDAAVPDFKPQFRSSLAYRMALVAEGRKDAMLTLRPSWEWDIAAGELILREAGAQTSDRAAGVLRFNNAVPKVNGVVAANPVLHDAITRALASG